MPNIIEIGQHVQKLSHTNKGAFFEPQCIMGRVHGNEKFRQPSVLIFYSQLLHFGRRRYFTLVKVNMKRTIRERSDDVISAAQYTTILYRVIRECFLMVLRSYLINTRAHGDSQRDVQTDRQTDVDRQAHRRHQ